MQESSPFWGITDQMLWGDLKPGERSALFVQQGRSPVYFFYLNTAPPELPEIAGVEAEPVRIELPEWAALGSGKLGLVQALIYDQCRVNNGYPYALTRADELAVIMNEEREALETMILQAVSRYEMPFPRLSRKAEQKRIARGPFRRRARLWTVIREAGWSAPAAANPALRRRVGGAPLLRRGPPMPRARRTRTRPPRPRLRDVAHTGLSYAFL